MPKRKDPLFCWKVHTPSLLQEISKGSGQPIYKIPLTMLLRLLGAVAERASELNDPELNALMCKLALYAVADPYDKDYDAKVVDRLIKQAHRIQQQRLRHEQNVRDQIPRRLQGALASRS